MPSVITHAVTGVAAGAAWAPERPPPRFWLLSAALPVLPDADVVMFAFGVPYAHVLGHRGLSHSLAFAAVMGVLAAWVCRPRGAGPRGSARRWWALAGYFTALTASHGLLDMLTDGGLGIALLAPFSAERYFWPWRPVRVSPIGVERFLSPWGLRVLASEALWLWLPAGAGLAAALAWRRLAPRRRAAPEEAGD